MHRGASSSCCSGPKKSGPCGPQCVFERRMLAATGGDDDPEPGEGLAADAARVVRWGARFCPCLTVSRLRLQRDGAVQRAKRTRKFGDRATRWFGEPEQAMLEQCVVIHPGVGWVVVCDHHRASA